MPFQRRGQRVGRHRIVADRQRPIGLDGEEDRLVGTRLPLAVVDGSSTGTSTVASGAAIMKMISSTRITSMNGVTLISWVSAKSSPSCPRRIATALLRRSRHRRDTRSQSRLNSRITSAEPSASSAR